MVKYSDVLLSKDDSIQVPNNGPQNVSKPSLEESMKALGWIHFPLQHFWNIGFQARPVLNIMMELPPRLRLAMMLFSDALQYMAQDATKTLENKILLSGLDPYMPDALEVSHSGNSDEAMYWEEELQHGLIRIVFDPSNQSRKSFDVNTRAAHIWNSGKEELLGRFQAYDVPSQLTDIDWIRAFAMNLTTYFDDTVTQIQRFTMASGGKFNTKLVSTTTTKTFDSVGRISQAPPFPPPCITSHRIRIPP